MMMGQMHSRATATVVSLPTELVKTAGGRARAGRGTRTDHRHVVNKSCAAFEASWKIWLLQTNHSMP
jgi:hypothetical protein